jgi:hypothetical protein
MSGSVMECQRSDVVHVLNPGGDELIRCRHRHQYPSKGKIATCSFDAGLDTFSKQAAVLGVSRSTAWAVLHGDHKATGLSAITIKRMLASPDLPPAARRIIEEYTQEKLLGAYGHSKAGLRHFRALLGHRKARRQI